MVPFVTLGLWSELLKTTFLKQYSYEINISLYAQGQGDAGVQKGLHNMHVEIYLNHLTHDFFTHHVNTHTLL